jgi:HEAT repeat protein
MNWKSSSGIVLRLAMVGAALAAQTSGQTTAPPKTENAKVEQRSVTLTFAQTVAAWVKSASRAEWLGYAVPAVSGDRQACCGDWNGNGSCGPCRLEGGDHGSNINLRGDKLKLEGPQNLVVLLRAENGSIGRIRTVSEDCTIDAGGLKVIWLSDVKPAESVKYLEKFVTAQEFEEHGHDRLSRGALSAIAMTGDASADQAIASFTAPDKPESLRRETAFWAGEARGAAGLAVLKRMAKNDPSSEVRAQVTFALSVSRESEALDEMIRMAHEDTSTHVRGQALFWLAQKAGKKAASTISGAIDDDPDTEVKKKAVFALSQMPKDEGVPKLIEVAQNNRNPDVRKQAMFWLGQSNDPRALEFFEKVLSQ